MATLLLICDVQKSFGQVIGGYQHLVFTTNKFIKFAKLLDIPVIATTQYAKALGPLDPAIDTASLGDLYLGIHDKTLFGMLIPEVIAHITDSTEKVILLGIEAHICVLQTVRDLSTRFPRLKIYVLADAVSSVNRFEVSVALQQMRGYGAIITTSESLAFELIGDAKHPKFKEFSKIVKEEKDRTQAAGDALVAGRL
ncbi:isochorismatase domain-containing protein [Moniliophthora roreri MCA 2997]|uniref:Isochorismatase domain-containing protein n=2 Tax=Moniliophthora roreri TaxID=221103 RepID=V2XM44_MONRO|nr:isochorismatase domain-containing protein [Moniliophthora roreri MCA 2997]KAI3611026.1 isochorismatase domain-containing protein [Moniliophthora roreri]